MTKEEFKKTLRVKDYNWFIDLEPEEQDFYVVAAQHMKLYKEKVDNELFQMSRYLEVMREEGVWE